MSVRAWPLSFLTLCGYDFEFCCVRLCRSTSNIPVKPSYRRTLSTLLPSIGPSVCPFDVPPKITNSLAYMDLPPTSAAASQSASVREPSTRHWLDC